MPENGYIKARIYTSRGEIPILGAIMTVTQTENGNTVLLGKRTSDKSGITTSVTVEAPDLSQSQSPSEKAPFSLADVRVDHPEYYSVFIGNVQIFAKQTTIIDTSLIPLAENERNTNKAEIFTQTPQNL